MPLRRFLLRTLMIAVAVVAFGLAFTFRTISWLYADIKHQMTQKALLHGGQEAFYRSHAALWDQAQGGGCMEIIATSPKDYAKAAAWAHREADYHAVLKRNYERAAHYPWLPVAPDPPPPPPLQ